MNNSPKAILRGLGVTCFAIVVLAQASCQSKDASYQSKDPNEVALNDLLNTYKIGPDRIESTSKTEVSGLIVTLPHRDKSKEVSYWVTFAEVTPVSGGVPQPDKMWKRLNMIGISRSSWDGKKWSRELTDVEFNALKQVASTKDVVIQDDVMKEVVRNKVIPSAGFAEELRSRQTNYLVRSATLYAIAFELKTDTQLGANLMGVTTYIDQHGKIITRTEEILHQD